jgi:hypothetical protein
VEANYTVIVKDLSDLQSVTNRVASTLGAPATVVGNSFGSIWEQMQHMKSASSEQLSNLKVELEKSFNSLQDLPKCQEDLQQTVLFMEEENLQSTENFSRWIVALESSVKSFDSRFACLLPILQQLKSNALSPQASSSIADQIQYLHSKVNALQDLDIQAQLKLLQLHIVGDGIQIGTCVFQSLMMC